MTDLTPREQEIAALVAKGMSNKVIARQLGIAEGTVKQHMHGIFRKLRIRNRATLAAHVVAGRNHYDVTAVSVTYGLSAQ